jgi:alpha,alpha-trehalase
VYDTVNKQLSKLGQHPGIVMLVSIKFPVLVVSTAIALSSCHVIKKCSSKIYCNGELLEAVQRSGLFADSKTFVDMPTKFPEEQVLKAFSKLGSNPRLKYVKRFVDECFSPAGSEMEIYDPTDWHPNPAFLQRIKSKELLTFAQKIHEKWRFLMRRVDKKKLCSKCGMSSMALPHPFVIPGGRFREFYYWDTFWIVEGMITSELCESVKGIIGNMLTMIDEFGFVPNGSRIYYLSRSQPPLLVDMIDRYMDRCIKNMDHKVSFLNTVISQLDREHAFWMTHRTVHMPNDPSKRLNVYRADQRLPRPESFREDTMIANIYKKDLQRAILFQDIASAAESGWDFSGRWFEDKQSMATIKTSKIIPIDLNSVLYNNEVKLSRFHGLLSNERRSAEYNKMAKDRLQVMRQTMYNQQNKSWADLDMATGKLVNEQYLSSLSPILFGMDQQGDLLTHKDLIFKYPGGAVISETYTGQQWDFPNVWAPYQYRLVNYHLNINKDRQAALNIAQRFVTSCYCGYKKYGYIFEKYHGERVGEPGGGGEYVVQEGFGWTNGVLLWLLETFPEELTAPITCTRYESQLAATKVMHLEEFILCIVLIMGLLVWGSMIVRRLPVSPLFCVRRQ